MPFITAPVTKETPMTRALIEVDNPAARIAHIQSKQIALLTTNQTANWNLSNIRWINGINHILQPHNENPSYPERKATNLVPRAPSHDMNTHTPSRHHATQPNCLTPESHTNSLLSPRAQGNPPTQQHARCFSKVLTHGIDEK